MKTKQFHLRLKPELWEWIKAEAELKEQSYNTVINRKLKESFLEEKLQKVWDKEANESIFP